MQAVAVGKHNLKTSAVYKGWFTVLAKRFNWKKVFAKAKMSVPQFNDIFGIKGLGFLLPPNTFKSSNCNN